MISVPCSLCGCRESRGYLVGKDRLLNRSREYTVVRCSACGFRYLSPRPHSSELAEHYPAGYSPYHTHLSKPSDKATQGGFSRFKWRMDCWNLKRMGYPMDGMSSPGWVERWLAPLRRGKFQHKILPPHGRCRMLDVGCGTGSFLYRHRDLGWETWGVEMSPVAGEVARRAGLRVIIGMIESADLPRGYFDLIVMMHVLEHVEDPSVVLAHLRPLLAPGGQVLIEVPNADSWGLRFWGTYWFPLELPRHFSHFGRADLTRLAEGTGYRVIRCLMRNESEWHASSLDYWLEERSWLPPALRKRPLAWSSKMCKGLRPLMRLLARGGESDALRVWLEMA
jgi:SAM-dependent methyltransferase